LGGDGKVEEGRSRISRCSGFCPTVLNSSTPMILAATLRSPSKSSLIKKKETKVPVGNKERGGKGGLSL